MIQPGTTMNKRDEILSRIPPAESPDELRTILFSWPGEIKEVAIEIARSGRVFDAALVQLLVVLGEGVPALLRNPAFPRELDLPVALWFAHRIQNEDKKAQQPALSVPSAGLGILFGERRVSVDSEPFAILRRLVAKGRGRLSARQVVAALTILDHPDAPAEVIRPVYDWAGADTELRASVLAHPNAPIEWARNAAPMIAGWSYEDWRALEILAQTRRLRMDDEVRPAIRKAAIEARSAEALTHLAGDGLNDCAEVFRALLDIPYSAMHVVNVLTRHAERVRPHLGVSEMSRLLTHHAQAVRAAAITTLGSAMEIGAEQVPDPSISRKITL